MAVIVATGFEVVNPSTGGLSPDNPATNAGTATLSSVAPRTGATAARMTATGDAVALYDINALAVPVTTFIRTYVRLNTLPGANGRLISTSGDNIISAQVTSGGKIQLWNDNTAAQIGSDSTETVVAGTYFRLELKQIYDVSGNVTDVELRLNGVTVASTSGLSLGAGLKWSTLKGISGITLDHDDVQVNDSTGGVNDTWPGDGNVILMKPISDNARGNWTAGAGGTTNLFDAVNNTPPVGVADSSATNTSQVKIKSTSLPSNCDLNLDTYLNANVPSGATINATALWVNHGEDPSTGTKAGTAAIVSNPSSGTVSFNFGDDVGAQGTYLGNWKWAKKITDNPAPTLSTAPVVRVTCTSGSTGTRAASCDFLGVYVAYQPAATRALPLPNPTNHQNPGIF